MYVFLFFMIRYLIAFSLYQYTFFCKFSKLWGKIPKGNALYFRAGIEKVGKLVTIIGTHFIFIHLFYWLSTSILFILGPQGLLGGL